MIVMKRVLHGESWGISSSHGLSYRIWQVVLALHGPFFAGLGSPPSLSMPSTFTCLACLISLSLPLSLSLSTRKFFLLPYFQTILNTFRIILSKTLKIILLDILKLLFFINSFIFIFLLLIHVWIIFNYFYNNFFILNFT